MEEKTNLSAVVVIPPEDLWEPIQRIRRKYDKKIDRWMPHINLLYPFRPREAFEGAAARMSEVLKGHMPFGVTLGRVRHFAHGYDRFTMWLEPQPSEPLIGLQAALQGLFPDCTEVSSFKEGYVPHLSVGQARGARFLESRLNEIRAFWRPIRFTVGDVALVTRLEGTRFEVDRRVPLGGPCQPPGGAGIGTSAGS